MPERDSGFHRLDPDWTRGRGQAIGEAEALARMQAARACRKVTFKQDDE